MGVFFISFLKNEDFGFVRLKFFRNDVSLIFWGAPPLPFPARWFVLDRPQEVPGGWSGGSHLQKGQTAAKIPWHRALQQGDTRAASSTGFALTFEEDDLVVAGSLVDRVQAVQVERQTPPETVDLSRLEGDQVLIASQSPEVLAWRNTLDITEAHCKPAAPGSECRAHGSSGEPSGRWEPGATGALLPGGSCYCFLFLAVVRRDPLFQGVQNNPPDTALELFHPWCEPFISLRCVGPLEPAGPGAAETTGCFKRTDPITDSVLLKRGPCFSNALYGWHQQPLARASQETSLFLLSRSPRSSLHTGCSRI